MCTVIEMLNMPQIDFILVKIFPIWKAGIFLEKENENFYRKFSKSIIIFTD